MEKYETKSTHSNANLNYYVNSLIYTLEQLKHAFQSKDKMEVTRVAAYERLAEISKIMRVILEQYPQIESKDLLLNASNLIRSVKLYNYDNYSAECHCKLVDSISKLYSSFHSSISNYVMEDIISKASSSPAVQISTSDAEVASITSSYSNSNSNSNSVQVQQPADQHQLRHSQFAFNIPEEKVLAHPDGLNIVLNQAKIWSKYVKDIVSFIEKRTQIEIEYNRSIIKNAQNFKASQNEQSFLPFQNIFSSFSDKEIDNANTSLLNFDRLTQDFYIQLNEHRIEFDKKLKKIKENYARETKKLQESTNNLTKSLDMFKAKKHDLEKMKSSESTGADWTNSDKFEKKRRAEEEALIKAKEAGDNYKRSTLEVNSQLVHMKKFKREQIVKIQDMLNILELRIKEIMIHYFDTLKDSMTYSPNDIRKIIDDTNLYEIGKSYKDFANNLPLISNKSCQNSSVLYASQYLPESMDSSESDNNSPSLRVPSQILARKQSSPVCLEMAHNEFDLDNHMNFITKTLKNFTTSFSNDHLHHDGIAEKNRQIFGIPLERLTQNCRVPSIVKKCVEEIEIRGSQINGIYRVSGVKSKVDSLLDSLEANSSMVDLSNVSPNIVANVLKHFFRELPEPLLTFQLYPDFIKVAKIFASNHTVENEQDIVTKLKQIVSRMPSVHYNTLKYLMRHLRRISHNCSINNMPPSNLGIVFGPTLLRRNNEKNASATTLFDTNHQGRVIELLIIYANDIFDMCDEGHHDDNENNEQEVNVKTNTQNSFNREPVLHVVEKSMQHSKHSQQSKNEANFRIFKSATCSSINPQNNQFSKQNIVEARRQFFNSSGNSQLYAQQPSNKYLTYLTSSSASNAITSANKSYVPNDSNLSPFSQIAAAASSSTSSSFIVNQNKINQIKKLPSSNFHPLQSQPGKIYQKNELSKSSSSLYSFKPNNMSIIKSSEDLV